MSELIPSTTPIRTFEDHEESVMAVAVLPNMRRMVTGSEDKTLCLCDLETGVVLKKMEGHSNVVLGLAVSRDGQIIASSDKEGGIIAWRGETGESLTEPIKAHSDQIWSVDFSPDGAVLATGSFDSTTKFWCTKTWQMQGEPIQCGYSVYCVRYPPSGDLLAIATSKNIEIYNPGTREHVTSLESCSFSLAWTPDGTRLLSGGNSKDPTIREWDTLTWQQVGRSWEGHIQAIYDIAIHPAGTLVASASDDMHVRLWRLSDRQTIAIFRHSSTLRSVTFSSDGKHILSGGNDEKISEWAVPKNFNSKILAITTAYDACVTGDLSTAEELLTQEIHTDPNNYTSYAHRSFIMSQKYAWDLALEDAIKSISIQSSLTGYISKAIALCGKGHVREARIAFDVASVFTDQYSNTNHFLILIKAIALFNADQHEEAMLLIKELAAACPNTDPLARHVVETYLRVQLGINALDGTRHEEAADHFTTAVNSTAFLLKYIRSIYVDFTPLFGLDIKSLCLTAHQNRCQAFLLAGKPDEALEAHKYMMDTLDESAKTTCVDWSNKFKEQCSALAEQKENDRILGAEIPGQEHDGYDTEPNFFHGMHQHSQISRPRPQQRHGRLKRLRLAMTRIPRSAPPPAPTPASPTIPSPPTTPAPVTAARTFRTQLRHLFTRPPHHATPLVVNVPFAKAKERNAAADAPGKDPDIVPYEEGEDLDATQPDPNAQQQPQPQQQSPPAVAVQVDTGEHGGGWSCCCC